MENFIHKKKYGQNFLNDNNILNKIINSANIDKNTLVLEIGPGQGALSKYIIPKAKYAILYEIDKELDFYLSNLNVGDNFKINYCDFLDVDLRDDISNYKFDKLFVVANLPYYITTAIITKFIDENVLPDKLVIMVQKEVADRLTSKVGSKDYSSITVLLNYYFNISKLCDVSRKCFVPVPNVDSSVLVMTLNKNRIALKNNDFFKRIVRDSFQFKRKNIKNNLKKYNLEKVSYIFDKYGYSLTDRAENFSIDFFVELSNAFSE